MNVKEIVSRCDPEDKCDEESLFRVMRLLAADGVFEEKKGNDESSPIASFTI